MEKVIRVVTLFLDQVIRIIKKGPKIAAPDIIFNRHSICKSCPEYQEAHDLCTECFCIMSVKTKLHAARCPLNKW